MDIPKNEEHYCQHNNAMTLIDLMTYSRTQPTQAESFLKILITMNTKEMTA